MTQYRWLQKLGLVHRQSFVAVQVDSANPSAFEIDKVNLDKSQVKDHSTTGLV